VHRTALLLATLPVLAGCAGVVTDGSTATPSPGSPDDGATATTVPTTTATPTATPYPNATPPFPSGPKSRPERPEWPTAGTAADYGLRYEFRHSYNGLWKPDAEVGLSVDSCGVESTAEHRSGYRVAVRCVGYVNQPVSGETRTQHADLPPWTVRYYVDANSLHREEVEE
jgi:hypothetical protein